MRLYFLYRRLHPGGRQFPIKPAAPVDKHQRAHLLVCQVDDTPLPVGSEPSPWMIPAVMSVSMMGRNFSGIFDEPMRAGILRGDGFDRSLEAVGVETAL